MTILVAHPYQVGVVGAGQLARMILQAAISLGLNVRILAASRDDGAALISPNVAIGSPDSYEALADLATSCDVMTFDHELVAVGVLQRLEEQGHRVYPTAHTMAIAQDKLLQHERFALAGLPLLAHAPIADAASLHAFGCRHGWPVVLKTARGGYDGRGVWVAESLDAAGPVLRRARDAGLRLLAESFASVERELAVMVARRPNGEAVVYPAVETVQVNGICHEVLAPAPVDHPVAEEATSLALKVASAVDVVGVFAVELFQVRERLYINEIAARPHNSGHYSIEGCITSQFE
ncbi:MAG: 5-(carboxyamino)imidazole ribonucleotide synthase, partial [Dehalococcoidia bacterium]